METAAINALGNNTGYGWSPVEPVKPEQENIFKEMLEEAKIKYEASKEALAAKKAYKEKYESTYQQIKSQYAITDPGKVSSAKTAFYSAKSEYNVADFTNTSLNRDYMNAILHAGRLNFLA